MIVSHTFPPNPGVGGKRILGMAKYLSRKGIFCYLVVNKLQDRNLYNNTSFKVIDVGRPIINRNVQTKKIFLNIPFPFKSTIKQLMFLPDREISWFEFAYNAAKEIIQKEKIEIVITSSLPNVAHFVGAKLKLEFPKIKWVVEMRDLWSDNHYVNNNLLLRKVSDYYERRTLLEADALVTVSEPLADILRTKYKRKKVYSITNAFDFDYKIKCDLDEKFSISYTGILYEGKRDPREFLSVVKELVMNDVILSDLVEINFYGPYEKWLDRFILQNNMQGYVNLKGIVSFEQSIKIQSSSQLLLFINSMHELDKGVYSAKVFEYLNASRPIIAIGNTKGVIEDLINLTNAGEIAKNPEQMKNVLIRYYKEYETNKFINFEGNQEEINKFSFEEMVTKYLKVFMEL